MSMLHDVLKFAVDSGASDVHLKPNRPPILRLQGRLQDAETEPLSPEMLRHIADDLTPPHQVEAYATRHEADFSHVEDGVGRFRVNLFQAQGNPCFVMRHVQTAIPTVEQLRLPTQLNDFAAMARGIVLACGPTGSGKSSTLAAMIGQINRTRNVRIITVEDPIEYMFQDERATITQREVGIDTDSFTESLIRLMRQDPDVVLIGEMRDPTSIQTALQAAQTGHLVLSTLHASSASGAIPRLLDMFPSAEHHALRTAIAETQFVMLCQRMMVDVHGKRIPAVEILVNTSTVRKLLNQNRLDVLHAAIETGRQDGMQTFDQAICDMIKEGIVSEAEGLQNATNPESLKMNLKGIHLDEGQRILADLL